MRRRYASPSHHQHGHTTVTILLFLFLTMLTSTTSKATSTPTTTQEVHHHRSLQSSPPLTLNVLTLGFMAQNHRANWLGGRSAALNYIFPIAFKHFNERRSDIIPALAALKNTCAVQMKLNLVDDEGDPTTGMQLVVGDLRQEQTHVILGPVRSAVATPLAVVGSALHIPILSHWATVPALRLNPYFARTCPADDAQTVIIAGLLQTWNITRFAMVYLADDQGTAFRDALFASCAALGISMSPIGYPDLSDEPLEIAVRSAMQQTSGFNVVFFIYGLNTQSFFYLAKAAHDLNMLTPERFYLTTLNDPNAADFLFPQNVSLLRAFLWNAVTIIGGIPGLGNAESNPSYDAFAMAWRTFNVSDVNPYLPQYSINGVSFLLPPDFFVTSPDSDIFAASTWTYDAVMALGLAACSLNNESIYDGAALNEAIRSTRFVGTSGFVSFLSDGDRDPGTSVYLLQRITHNISIVPAPPSEIINIGIWTPRLRDWTFYTDLFQFRDGTSNIPRDITVPPENLNLIPSWAKALGYFEIALVLTCSVVALIWLRLHIDTHVVKLSQPDFMVVIAIGVMLIGGAIIPLTMEYDDGACMTFPWLLSLGMTCAMGSIAIKALRVAQLWNNKPNLAQKRRETIGMYMRLVGGLLLINVILLLAWTLDAPLVYRRTVSEKDFYGNPTESYGLCVGESEGTTGFLAALLVYEGLIATCTVAMSVYVSNAPAEFHEAKWTAVAAVVLAQAFLFGIPVVAVVQTQPTARYLVLSTLCFVTSLALLGSMFVPKVWKTQSELMRSKPGSQPSRSPHTGGGGGGIGDGSGPFTGPGLRPHHTGGGGTSPPARVPPVMEGEPRLFSRVKTVREDVLEVKDEEAPVAMAVEDSKSGDFVSGSPTGSAQSPPPLGDSGDSARRRTSDAESEGLPMGFRARSKPTFESVISITSVGSGASVTQPAPPPPVLNTMSGSGYSESSKASGNKFLVKQTSATLYSTNVAGSFKVSSAMMEGTTSQPSPPHQPPPPPIAVTEQNDEVTHQDSKKERNGDELILT